MIFKGRDNNKKGYHHRSLYKNGIELNTITGGNSCCEYKNGHCFGSMVRMNVINLLLIAEIVNG